MEHPWTPFISKQELIVLKELDGFLDGLTKSGYYSFKCSNKKFADATVKCDRLINIRICTKMHKLFFRGKW